jgi:Mlc titration factor MtfA (ptsG expression regulator)
MGLTSKQNRRLERLYREHHQRDPDNRLKTWTDNYAAENTQEYFAQSTNCFFGTNSLPGNNNGREWLAANDRPMYDFMVELYDRSIDRRGRVREESAA